MATRSDEIDDDFADIYKEYTGPPRSVVNSTQDKAKINKRPSAESDEEEGLRDPNAVPTDFTSREAKFWEAKSKATERNWKKRKEEEMICKICGESGHFTQGCPSLLEQTEISRLFERVPAREKHVKDLFTEKVIQRIEIDIGCKIKMEEKFIIVSGKDRLILAKGVDAVHKVIKGEVNQKGSSSSHRSRSRSPDRSPVGSRLRHSESQRSYSGHPKDMSHYQQRFSRQDKFVEDRVRGDVQKFSRVSPQARAYGNGGARGRSSHSKSPARAPYASNSLAAYDGYSHKIGGYRTDGWDTERRGADLQSGHQFDYSAFPPTLEELEMEYNREVMELSRIRDKEEDEENYKHRETMREMRENYTKKLALLRGTHARQWEEFIQVDAHRRQQQTQQQMSAPSFGGYKQHAYADYDGSSTNPQYVGSNLPIDPSARYPSNVENYPSRPHDTYGEFQRQRRDNFGKAYNRY
ncbi:hypothetical protein K2173_013153 [Erythroxylum novogranatense]|uniref:CCHC-type domain-containing protein n=1 Tax=Erythroxylum novogranatense TaxID=1862640 RepID=A0AAV8S519_9ROSI|nr:hypothetical protein K2173_013153 [Erythroxylum novogranatense]